jgi:DEAD_2
MQPSKEDVSFCVLQYNYLVDPQTRMGMKHLQWRNSVLIFDEAHNVEVTRSFGFFGALLLVRGGCAGRALRSRAVPIPLQHGRLPTSVPVLLQGVCSEAASFDLPAPVLTGCIKEVEQAYRTAMLRLESQSAQIGAASTCACRTMGCCG